MEPKPGRLVKAVYDFPTDDPSELPLLVGDIVQVKERIDKQWSQGVSNNHEGSFPIGFTVEVKIPSFSEENHLFAVTNDFPAQEDGDLTMKKGDIVVGKQAIDSNWWRGEIEGQTGIFPLTHVWEIDKKLIPNSNSLKKMSLKARVKINLKAQIDEEMDLYQDEIVTIIEEVDKGWYRGECNGRQGIFPASFVTIVSEDTVPSISEPFLGAPTNDVIENENHTGYDWINSGIRPYGRTTYAFKAEYANELSFHGGEIVNLLRYVDDNWLEGEIDGKTGIFPANFVNVVVDCPKSKEGSSKSKENGNDNDMNLFPEDTYGRVKYDFYPQLEGDVSLREGDTVTLIRKVDSNWYEVVTDNGETGICPESYIEIIGSGPPSYNEVMGAIYDFPVNPSSIATDNNAEKTKNSTYGDSPSFANSNSFSSQSEKSVNSNSFMNAQNLSSHSSGSNGPSFDSTVSSFSTYDNKPTSASLSWFDDSGINQDWKAAERNGSFSSSRETYQNVPDISNDLLNWNTVESENSKRDSLISITKTPARPPPPSNVSYSRNRSSLSNSDSLANNARLSFVSMSSVSSSDTERLNVEELKSQLQQKEQTLKVRMACKNKLENEKGQSNGNFVSNEMKTQLNQLNGEITQIQLEISNLKAQVSENSGDCSSEESEAREREVARKKELELKRREEEKK